MVLTRGDDYPLHQTSEPVAYSGTDRNFYDRYFFNGYAPDGSGFFAAAFGVYPHLDIADAHFSFIRDGRQYSLHASMVMGMERMALRCGPISIEVLEPLNKLRVVVEEYDGIAADVTFTGRAFPIEEPRFIHRHGPRAFMDYTRMTQNGHFTGWITLDGDRQDLAPGTCGTRDRSWGVRPVGTADAQPNPHAPTFGFFWQWTPINLTNRSLFFHLNANPDGTPWNTKSVLVPDGWDGGAHIAPKARLDTGLELGTRWPARSQLVLKHGETTETFTLDPLVRFQMKGLGYTHPKWGHGQYHGALEVEREDIDLATLNSADPSNLHVQMLCRVSGPDQGMGVFEQLAIGPYAPLGLTGITDGA